MASPLEELLSKREEELGIGSAPRSPFDDLLEKKERELGAPGPQALPLEEPAGPSVFDRLSASNKRVDDYFRPQVNQDAPAAQGLQGFYAGTANLLGLPVEAANELLNHIGEWTRGKPAGFLDQPGNAQAAIKEGMRKVGINVPAKDLDTYAYKIGQMLPSAMAGTAGLLGAAPRIAAIGGTNAWAESARQIGQAAVRAPGLTAVTDIAAVPGAVVGGDLAKRGTAALVGEDSPWTKAAEATGMLVGGTLTGGATVLLRGGKRAPMRDRFLREGELSAIADYADDAVRAETQLIDREIRGLVRSAASTTRSPDETFAAFERGIEGLDTAWRGRMRDLYSVAPNITHDAQDLHQLGQQMMTAHSMNPTARPTLAIRNLNNTIEMPGAPPGTTLLREPSTQELMEWRSDLLRQAREARGSTVNNVEPNRPLIRNLEILQGRVLEVIDRQLANNPDWTAARNFAVEYNNRFTRGPIARVMEEGKRGDYRRHPQQMFQELLDSPNGLAALHDAGQPPMMPGAPPLSGRTPSNQPLMAAGARSYSATDEAIRQRYQQVIQEAGQMAEATPGAGRFEQAAAVNSEKWRAQHARSIENYTGASLRVNMVADDLSRALRDKNAWSESALAKYTGTGGKSMIDRQFTSSNPAREAQQFLGDLARTLQGNPIAANAAREAWEYQTVKTFMNLGGKSTIDKVAMMESPRWQDFFRLVLGSQQRVDHMTDMLSGMARMEAGTTHVGTKSSLWRTVGEKSSPWISTVLGLHLGSALVKGLFSGSGRGAASLHMPSRMARAMREMSAAAFRKDIAPDLLTQALLDPTQAKILLREVPGTPEAAEATARAMLRWSRRINAGLDFSSNRLIEQGHKDEEKGRDYKPGAGRERRVLQLTQGAGEFTGGEEFGEAIQGINAMAPKDFKYPPGRESDEIETRVPVPGENAEYRTGKNNPRAPKPYEKPIPRPDMIPFPRDDVDYGKIERERRGEPEPRAPGVFSRALDWSAGSPFRISGDAPKGDTKGLFLKESDGKASFEGHVPSFVRSAWEDIKGFMKTGDEKAAFRTAAALAMGGAGRATGAAREGAAELGAFGSAPRRATLKGEGFEGYAGKVRDLVDAAPIGTNPKEILQQYRKAHGEAGVSDLSVLKEINGQMRAVLEEGRQTVMAMPTTQDILKKHADAQMAKTGSAEGPLNYSQIAKEIREAAGVSEKSGLVQVAAIREKMIEMGAARGDTAKPLQDRSWKAPNRDAKLLDSPQIERIIAEADGRGESAGMITNMVKRAMGIRASDRGTSITTEEVASKIGTLRDKMRRSRGGGDV